MQATNTKGFHLQTTSLLSLVGNCAFNNLLKVNTDFHIPF